jgi:hypothetical protein
MRCKLVLVLWLAVGSLPGTGCHTVVQTNCFEVPRGGHGLEPGQIVVARFRAEFYQGVVFTVRGKLVTVMWDEPPPEKSHLPLGWVQPVSDPAARVREGDPALCDLGDNGRWSLCQVKRVDREVVTVIPVTGSDATVPRDRVIPVPKGLTAWARKRLDQLLEQRKLQATINPTAPLNAGSPVTVGQTVLAMWGSGGWWEATVRTVGGGSVTVSWGDGSGEATMPASKVAPLPESSTLSPGDLALCSWSGSKQWFPARVDRVEDKELHITYRDGTKGVVQHLRCAPAR